MLQPHGTSHGPPHRAGGSREGLPLGGPRGKHQGTDMCLLPRPQASPLVSLQVQVSAVGGRRGGHELGFAANSCRWLVSGPAPSPQQSHISQKKALFPAGETLQAEPAIPTLHLPLHPPSSPSLLSQRAPQNLCILKSRSGEGQRSPPGCPTLPVPSGTRL